ncbi:MAG: beta-propeller fold lactonase family protein, partial [Candidatus Bathyarchaeia archaeon]
MKRGKTKALRVGGILLVFFLYAFASLLQPIQAGNTATITVGGMPSAVAITPNGEYAYVTNGHNVSVISTATNKVTTTVTAGSNPSNVAITPNGEYAYVANGGDGTVSVINTATKKVIATVTVGGAPSAVAIT